MTTPDAQRAFEEMMPEPFGYIRLTPVYTVPQMRQMFDAATERAAKVCEAETVEELTDGDLAYNMATRHCAAAIRAKTGGEGC